MSKYPYLIAYLPHTPLRSLEAFLVQCCTLPLGWQCQHWDLPEQEPWQGSGQPCRKGVRYSSSYKLGVSVTANGFLSVICTSCAQITCHIRGARAWPPALIHTALLNTKPGHSLGIFQSRNCSQMPVQITTPQQAFHPTSIILMLLNTQSLFSC